VSAVDGPPVVNAEITEDAERAEKASGASRGVGSRFMGLISLAPHSVCAERHRPTMYGVVAQFRRLRSAAFTRPVLAVDGPPGGNAEIAEDAERAETTSGAARSVGSRFMG